MVGRIGIHQGAVILAAKIDVDVDSLPASVDLGPNLKYKTVQIAIGAALLAALSIVWSYGIQGVEQVLTFSVFAGLAVAILAYGAYLLPLRRVATFYADRVSVQTKTWGGSEQWSLSYADYAGVLLKESQVSKGQFVSTMQMIELHHRNPKRSVLLYAKETKTMPRAKWKAFARAFNLPALQESG